jgi:hypothetical protein
MTKRQNEHCSIDGAYTSCAANNWGVALVCLYARFGNLDQRPRRVAANGDIGGIAE